MCVCMCVGKKNQLCVTKLSSLTRLALQVCGYICVCVCVCLPVCACVCVPPVRVCVCVAIVKWQPNGDSFELSGASNGPRQQQQAVSEIPIPIPIPIPVPMLHSPFPPPSASLPSTPPWSRPDAVSLLRCLLLLAKPTLFWLPHCCMHHGIGRCSLCCSSLSLALPHSPIPVFLSISLLAQN